MAKATWNGVVLAESDTYEIVEGNVYFPAEAINRDFFTESSSSTVCPWKGTASYLTIEVNGKINKDAAWFYPEPKDAASQIKNFVAFWRGVKVER